MSPSLSFKHALISRHAEGQRYAYRRITDMDLNLPTNDTTFITPPSMPEKDSRTSLVGDDIENVVHRHFPSQDERSPTERPSPTLPSPERTAPRSSRNATQRPSLAKRCINGCLSFFKHPLWRRRNRSTFVEDSSPQRRKFSRWFRPSSVGRGEELPRTSTHDG